MKPIEQSSFLLVANGAPGSPPVSGVGDFLAERARETTIVLHPLNRGDPPVHHVSQWRDGRQVAQRELRRPSRPPLSYALDVLTPLWRPRVDGWLGFSNLSALHGIARRRAGLAGAVAYWAVDFVPDRFGAGSPLSRAYDRVDRLVSTRADLRVELTTAARDGRTERLGLGTEAAPTHIAPIGVWLERTEQAPEDGWRSRRIVYTGHLVPRQGVTTLLRAVALLPDVTLDITGRGPEEPALRALAAELGLGDRVRFLGFLPDLRDVERVLAGAAVAAAPYATDPDSFSRFADPSKIRSYAAAGLPVVMTDVPPNARELEREAGAEVVPFDAQAIAAAIDRILASPEEWKRRRAAALGYSQGFDWGRIVTDALARLGFSA